MEGSIFKNLGIVRFKGLVRKENFQKEEEVTLHFSFDIYFSVFPDLENVINND